jgi:hypothetical protein
MEELEKPRKEKRTLKEVMNIMDTRFDIDALD